MAVEQPERDSRWWLVLAVMLLLVALFLVIFALVQHPPTPIQIVPPPPTPTDPPTVTPAPLAIYVSGAVNRPGVVALPIGSRVEDALAAAGGPSEQADLVALNLAALLADGQQVHVPLKGETTRPLPTLGVELININTATAAQLEALPGIGETIAARIVAHRQANGPFVVSEDLMAVPGIGQAKFDACREMITVGP